jgi:mono/diheme cytochrome c family protein
MVRVVIWGVAAASLVSSLAGRMAAQAPSIRSTMSGVYTNAQARRGEDTFMGTCVSCHPIATYTGTNFAVAWGRRPLSDLFDWVSTKMPKSDPGSLTPKEAAQVVAYILKKNEIPPGKTDLPPDEAVLSKIRIETPAMQGDKK